MFRGVLLLPKPFSLGLTLLCGQCFRWEGPDGEGRFNGVAGQAFWRLRQASSRLEWECSSKRVRKKPAPVWLSRYLSLDEDLEEWTRSMESHPVLKRPARALKGLRLLRQEPWECTVSYMFAQGLSVKVIRHAIGIFCERFGRPVKGASGRHSFPEPEALAGLSPNYLKPFTNHYRARADRIIRLARAVQAKTVFLNRFNSIPCDEARKGLMALDGIGPKIADCILLFSMDQPTAFPVDRWVFRAMQHHYRSIKLMKAGDEAPTRLQYLKIVRKARETFGSRCGIAGEYLFLFLRLLDDARLRKELGPFLPNS